MKHKGLVIGAAAVLVVGALLFWISRGPQPSNEIDLIAGLGTAEKKTNQAGGQEAIVTEEVTIDGAARRAILTRPFTRLIFTIAVPPDAWFETFFALKPESWDQPGDGAQFRIGVSEGQQYDELLRQHVDPRRGDRRWFSARLDLSAYEGRTVKLILNTDAGPPGSTDTANDEAVWAEPRVYSQR